jgi:hypothetical protein
MKKTAFSLFRILLLCMLIIQACKKDELEHPELETLSVTAVSPARIKVTGKVSAKGKYTISDHGFVYSTTYSTPDIQYGLKVSLGKDIADGEFFQEIPITGSYSYERTVYARAYLTNEKGTAYGDIISVKMPTVSTNGIAPTSGKAGDKITVNGNFSGFAKEDVNITVGNVIAIIESISSSKLVFVVPSGINTSSYYSNQVPVVLSTAGQTLTLNSYFLIKPSFSDFSPKSGTIGSTLTISGSNISSGVLYNISTRIYFGDISTTSYSVNSGFLTVSVPGNVSSDKFQITIETDGVKTILPGEFTLTQPTISSLSATTAWPGSSITIYGSNFSTSYSYYHTVSIGDVNASMYSTSSTQLTVTVPGTLTEGEYTVKVHSGSSFVSAPTKLKIKGTSLTGFSPASGAPGKEITLSGDFNPNGYYSVYFGSSVYASPFSITANSMKVYVPSGLNAGDVKISLKSGTTTLSLNDDFTVLAPSITNISPTSGVAGTIVTITGNGFTPNTYNNTVKFGTTNTPSILSATESTLRVLVPSNLTPGAMKISVTNNYGQMVVSPMNFTVTN